MLNERGRNECAAGKKKINKYQQHLGEEKTGYCIYGQGDDGTVEI